MCDLQGILTSETRLAVALPRCHGASDENPTVSATGRSAITIGWIGFPDTFLETANTVNALVTRE